MNMLTKLTQYQFKLNTSTRLVLIIYVVLMSFMLGMWTQQWIIKRNIQSPAPVEKKQTINLEILQEQVIPQKGYVFKINWGDLGSRLVKAGVIDKVKLAQAVSGSDSLPAELEKYLDGSNQEQLELNSANAHFWVDVLWALGLANKNEILDQGPMMEGGKPENFASTGGYTLGVKDAMAYYSKMNLIDLNSDQQLLVKEIAENVFRPCCGNSTAFPDCNHGMAALGLIELMVSQGFSKDEIYKTVLAFNSYWFPQTYLDIAYHFAKNDRSYLDVSASQVLSKTFSSASGYQAIKRQIGEVDWPILQKGGGCGA